MEFVVDAKPNDASGEFDGVVRGRAANIDSAGRSDGAATVLELDIEIFDSGGDVLAECGLDAGAGRPASSDDRQKLQPIPNASCVPLRSGFPLRFE